MDFDEINYVGLIMGLIGGGISILITARMGGGIVLKIIGFFVAAIACYFVGGKIADS